MKKLTITLTLAVMASLAVLMIAPAASASAVPPKPDKLVVSTWGFNSDLLQKNIAQAFEKQYGIKIVFDFGNNSARLTRLEANKGHPVDDVVTFFPTYAYMAQQKGLLQPLHPENIPNIADIVAWAQDPLGGHYGVGYTIQVYKLAYRTDKITPPVTSWRDFWRPELKGKIIFPGMNTSYGPATLIMCAKAWGGSEKNLEVGWEKIKELVDSGALLTTYTRSSQAISLFQEGEVWLAPIASFAWPSLKKTGLPLAWVTPKSAYWEPLVASVNILSVVKGTKNTYWAEKFINFWLSQSVQKQQALDLVDAPANTKVKLPADIASDFGLDEDIAHAFFINPGFVVQNLENWLSRWNEMIAK